jgi:hypothetical protein
MQHLFRVLSLLFGSMIAMPNTKVSKPKVCSLPQPSLGDSGTAYFSDPDGNMWEISHFPKGS